MSMTRVGFHELPEADFPFTVWFVNDDTGELLHSFTVAGSGATKIPGFAPTRVLVVMRWPDGRQLVQGPPD